jgi:hypothetical protein
MAVKGKLGQMEMEIHPSVVIANTENVLTFDVIKVNCEQQYLFKFTYFLFLFFSFLQNLLSLFMVTIITYIYKCYYHSESLICN